MEIHRYLCSAVYVDGNGSNRYTIDAASAEDAFKATLERLRESGVDPEREHRAVSGEEAVDCIIVEASRPLKPGQHPGTPPLWYTVAIWSLERRILAEWERADEEPEGPHHVFPDQAKSVAQALAGPNYEARVTSVTEFGTTGTLVPFEPSRWDGPAWLKKVGKDETYVDICAYKGKYVVTGYRRDDPSKFDGLGDYATMEAACEEVKRRYKHVRIIAASNSCMELGVS